MIRRSFLLLALASVVVGCGEREATPVSAPAPTLDWVTCGELECAQIVVARDRREPRFKSSARIELAAYRDVSPSPESRHLPLIIHPGGPGTDVRAAVVAARDALAPIIDDFDIYALSTRGSVDGFAFDCGPSLDDLRVVDTDADAALRFARSCLRQSSTLVGNVGTLDSVDDLETFRLAIGLEKVRYLGWSYGATLGAAWAMVHPGSLRAVVLDAPLDPRLPWPEVLPLRYEAAAGVLARRGGSSRLGDEIDRNRALAREYSLYEPATSRPPADLASLRLGETPDGNNDGGIETQIGVHCSDVTHAEASRAISVAEPSPWIGFGATFDRVCLGLPEAPRPLSGIAVDRAASRVDAMVVSTTGDHVIPSVVSRRLAEGMLWRHVVVDADRHLSVGFDDVATKKAMAFLATGD